LTNVQFLDSWTVGLPVYSAPGADYNRCMATIRSLPAFATFGEMLHYLRRRAQMTQQELALAVGYSESMISRLEHDERQPDVATIQALFVPATLYVVPALSCPDPQRLPALGKTKDYPAIQLFVERCQATAPGFQLVDDNMALAAHICAALDGIPLALELGAAATATLSLRDIAERLAAHLPLSGAGLRDSDPRHSSLRDTVIWSYHLLSPDEQRPLAQLSVFAGGCTLEALQQVCADELDHVDLLHHLVRKSLVRVEFDRAATNNARYHLLRAVYEYAAEQVDAALEAYTRRRSFDCWQAATSQLPSIYTRRRSRFSSRTSCDGSCASRIACTPPLRCRGTTAPARFTTCCAWSRWLSKTNTHRCCMMHTTTWNS